MKIDLAPPPGHRSGGRRSRTALIWLLHLRVTAQEGRGQIDLAPPPHLRGSLLHGDWEVEQPCFLVGNNQLTSPTPYTLYYYLPGNSPAPPPSHRAGGTTAYEEVE